MPCQWIKLADGTVVHLNMGRKPRKRCQFCKTGYVERLCDFATGLFGKTCDAGMCLRCATHIGVELDYCPKHKQEAQA